MTTETILDDDAIAEIEARADNASPHYVVNWSQGGHALMQASGWRPLGEEQPRTIASFDKDRGYFDLLFCAEARADIPALIQTVRALKAENEQLKADLVETRVRIDLDRSIKNTMAKHAGDAGARAIQLERQLTDAASAMRSRCVEVVEKFRQRIQYEGDEGVREAMFGDMVIEMESISLEEQNHD